MEINTDTIIFYMKDAETKIELLKTDLVTYEYRINQTNKEIETLRYLIGQYQKSLDLLQEGNKHA